MTTRKLHRQHPKFWYARGAQCIRCYNGDYCSYGIGKQLAMDRFYPTPGKYGTKPKVEYS